MALFLSSRFTFFPISLSQQSCSGFAFTSSALDVHHCLWGSKAGCESWGNEPLVLPQINGSCSFPLTVLGKPLSFLALVENSRSGPRKVSEPDSSLQADSAPTHVSSSGWQCHQTHARGSCVKMSEDEWNGNTGLELSLTLPLRVCPLDFFSWSLIHSS